ncbi:MAG: WalW protein [Sphingomonadaceae bacterium]|nr:WalW protein [Sphingomonadaceae bacterium]
MEPTIRASRECHARLDLPPPPEARIQLPADMPPRFAIFADAEEEFDWSGPFRREATAVTAIAALPEANARFAAARVAPTYLVDWPVADTPASIAVLAGMFADGACEIGTQLHPWVNPPFEEDVSAHASYLGNLPAALQRAKLVALTERIERAFGMRPTVYRAGRYGVGTETATILAESGYRLDASVRALFDYRHQGGPDFSRHPVWPWRVAPGLSELPLSVALTGPLRRFPGLRATPLRGLLNRVPLTPEGVPLGDAREAIRRLLGEGHKLFSLSFHTPSLVPGHTPYVRDAAGLRTFWAWWDGVFGVFARDGVTAIRASEIVALLGEAA